MSDDHQLIFRAIADPTRREIVALLSETDMNVNQIAAYFDMTRPGVAKHLTILEEGGVISTEKKGRQSINRVEPVTLKAVVDWVNFYSGYWGGKLQKLDLSV